MMLVSRHPASLLTITCCILVGANVLLPSCDGLKKGHRARKSVPSTAQHVNRTLLGKRQSWTGPGPHSFDYVLGANSFYNTAADVVFVDYDMEESDIRRFLGAGKVVICYVNVGAWEDWRSDAELFPESVLGNDYDGWPGERWLDIRNTDVILPLMRNRYRIAAAKGCQGIDPDNMNGWSVDTGFPISYENQLVYNRYVSAEARVLGMLAGLKNDNEQASDLIDAVDFAVLEQCAAYDECFYFDGFISSGKPVFAVEYTDSYDETSFRREVCPLVEETKMSFILKNYNLHSDYIYSCLL
ncbi:uncharacterized protein LOC110844223 [Folsomia candida]|uniref:Glycoside-hydrolase family GH114 TIM-barrel domain-containing protein n=1 Tax=Folsomia candida TaxID=158441 RepID=A0A226EP47_FOLCA|nr:uncharacterized protein LOC110844223 [Folsomia candida]OXA59060.1 hypothetical protein Fcan01_04805 [Folsomia candida]